MTELKKTINLGTVATLLAFLAATPTYARNPLDISFDKALGYEDIGVKDIPTLLSAIFTSAVVLAVILVFFMLVQGGYGYLMAGGDKAKVEEARTRMSNALIGLTIVAASFVTITLIGRFFGVDIGNIVLPSAAVVDSGFY